MLDISSVVQISLGCTFYCDSRKFMSSVSATYSEERIEDTRSLKNDENYSVAGVFTSSC